MQRRIYLKDEKALDVKKKRGRLDDGDGGRVQRKGFKERVQRKGSRKGFNGRVQGKGSREG